MGRWGLGKKMKDFILDETGQSTTEYILILAVVVMIALKFKKEFREKLDDIVGKLGSDIEKAADPERN